MMNKYLCHLFSALILLSSTAVLVIADVISDSDTALPYTFSEEIISIITKPNNYKYQVENLTFYSVNDLTKYIVGFQVNG